MTRNGFIGMTQGRNHFLGGNGRVADGANHAVGQAGFGAGGIITGNGFFGMAQGGNHFLSGNGRVADGANHTVGQAGFGAGGIITGNSFFGMTQGRNHFLGGEGLAAGLAVGTFGQAGIGAVRSNRLIGNNVNVAGPLGKAGGIGGIAGGHCDFSIPTCEGVGSAAVGSLGRICVGGQVAMLDGGGAQGASIITLPGNRVMIDRGGGLQGDILGRHGGRHAPAAEGIARGNGIGRRGEGIAIPGRGLGVLLAVDIPGNGVVNGLPLGHKLHRVLMDIGGFGNLLLIIINVLNIAIRLRAFGIPGGGASVGFQTVVPLILIQAVGSPAGKGVAGLGVGVGRQGRADTGIDALHRHSACASIGQVFSKEVLYGVKAGIRGLGIGVALEIRNTVVVGVGSRFPAVGAEIQLFVGRTNVNTLDFKQRGVSGAAGHPEGDGIRGVKDAARLNHIVQVIHQDHTAVQCVFRFRTGQRNKQRIIVIAKALVDPISQIQLFVLDINNGLVNGAELGHGNGGIARIFMDRTGIDIHTPFGNQVDVAAAVHLHNVHGRGANIAAIALQVVGGNLRQGAAGTLIADNGIASLLGSGHKNVRSAINAPHRHIIGMVQPSKIAITGAGIGQGRNFARVLIRHGNNSFGIAGVDFDGIHHLRSYGQALHTGAGVRIIDFSHIRIVAMENVGVDNRSKVHICQQKHNDQNRCEHTLYGTVHNILSFADCG